MLTAQAPLLLAAGAGGLAWWRLRHNGGLGPGSLRDNFRHNALAVATHEEELKRLLPLLRAGGVEPLLVKGWSVARLYPEPGLRPCGDLDLCVRPEELAVATGVLTAAAVPTGRVDLHGGVGDLEDRTWDEVVRRSRLVRLGSNGVRILGAEDQLRHLCLHLLRHGAWRPLWLCDVAVVMESLPSDFDWDYCLSGDTRLSQWVLCALGLARRLLDARLDDAAIAARTDRLPRWLPDTVLALWGSRQVTDFQPLRAYLRHPLGPWRFLRDRWRRNPIEVLFNARSRPFYRLSSFAVRAIAFLLRARGYAVRQLSPTPPPPFPAVALPFDVHPPRAA
jgi:hypothetical protein